MQKLQGALLGKNKFGRVMPLDKNPNSSPHCRVLLQDIICMSCQLFDTRIQNLSVIIPVFEHKIIMQLRNSCLRWSSMMNL